MKEVPLRNRAGDIVATALVDVADFAAISARRWCRDAAGYAVRGDKYGRVYMHRELMRPGRGLVIDHRNGNRLDNRRENLRVCTRADNCRNAAGRHRRYSRHKGVTYSPARRKWIAQIKHLGRHFALGSFTNEDEAKAAYDRRARELHGEFFHA